MDALRSSDQGTLQAGNVATRDRPGGETGNNGAREWCCGEHSGLFGGQSGDAASTIKEGKASKGGTPSGKAPNESSDSGKGWQHGEPHGRLQGAINLQSAAWSKPLKSGGTTRAEHV